MNDVNDIEENSREISIIKFAKDIEYFDSIYENSSNFFIVNVERHIFYRNSYVFVDRLKDLTKEFIEEQRIRKLVSNCLRDESLI